MVPLGPKLMTVDSVRVTDSNKPPAENALEEEEEKESDDAGVGALALDIDTLSVNAVNPVSDLLGACASEGEFDTAMAVEYEVAASWLPVKVPDSLELDESVKVVVADGSLVKDPEFDRDSRLDALIE